MYKLFTLFPLDLKLEYVVFPPMLSLLAIYRGCLYLKVPKNLVTIILYLRARLHFFFLYFYCSSLTCGKDKPNKTELYSHS